MRLRHGVPRLSAVGVLMNRALAYVLIALIALAVGHLFVFPSLSNVDVWFDNRTDAQRSACMHDVSAC